MKIPYGVLLSTAMSLASVTGSFGASAQEALQPAEPQQPAIEEPARQQETGTRKRLAIRDASQGCFIIGTPPEAAKGPLIIPLQTVCPTFSK